MCGGKTKSTNSWDAIYELYGWEFVVQFVQKK